MCKKSLSEVWLRSTKQYGGIFVFTGGLCEASCMISQLGYPGVS